MLLMHLNYTINKAQTIWWHILHFIRHDKSSFQVRITSFLSLAPTLTLWKLLETKSHNLTN